MESIRGLGCGRDTFLELPLPGDCAGYGSPLFSQIGAILFLEGRAVPTLWNDSSTWGSLIQGTGSGRYLRVTGALPKPAENRGTVGRPTNGSLIITHRKYTASLAPDLGCPEVADFVRGLQKNWRGWRFWLSTAGGRLIGGPNGIKPAYINAGLAYPGGRDSLEEAYMDIEWFDSVDAATAYVPGLTDGGGDPPGGPLPEPPEITCDMYSQYYVAHTGNTLDVTVNGGNIPAPYATRFWVFQNGQRLNSNVGQYFVTPDTSPGVSTVTINSMTHFDGSNYAVFLFP